jgi:hypothetical protein
MVADEATLARPSLRGAVGDLTDSPHRANKYCPGMRRVELRALCLIMLERVGSCFDGQIEAGAQLTVVRGCAK